MGRGALVASPCDPGLFQVRAEEAREHWENIYAFSLEHCSHMAW